MNLGTSLLPKFAFDIGYDSTLLQLISAYQKNPGNKTYQAVQNFLLKQRTKQQKIMDTFSKKQRLDLNILDYEDNLLWSTATLPFQDKIVLLYQSSEYSSQSTEGSSYKKFEDGLEMSLSWNSGSPIFAKGGALKFGATLLPNGSETIQGYYFWCYDQTPIYNSWCSTSAGALGSATWSSSMVTTTNTTANVIPSGTNMVLFQYGTAQIGYSNYFGTTAPEYGPGMLQYASYQYYGTTPYTNTEYTTADPVAPYNIGVGYLLQQNLQNAILNTDICYMVGIMFGGGGPADSTNVAYWTSDAINNILYAIQNPTNSGLLYNKSPKQIIQDSDGQYSGYGMSFNLLGFDIEVGDSGLLDDFLNLFQAAQEAGFQVMVIVNHTCSYGITDAGTTLIPGLYQSEYVNFISPEMYTENIATMNEYVANSQIPWMDASHSSNTNTVKYYVQQNPNYYNGEILVPGVLLYNSMPYSKCGGLMYSGGTNTGNLPNWTTYDGDGSGCYFINPQVATDGNEIYNYPAGFTTTNDPGVNSFLYNVFDIDGSYNIGGAVQWVNGDYQG